MLNQQLLQSRGARTILFTPEEHDCTFSVGSDIKTVHMIPLVGFKTNMETNVYNNEALILQ